MFSSVTTLAHAQESEGQCDRDECECSGVGGEERVHRHVDVTRHVMQVPQPLLPHPSPGTRYQRLPDFHA